MREIKFRLFGKNSEEFLGVAPYGLSLKELQNVCDLDAWHVMQFTGLTDKNGVEIYEGDILEEDNQLFSVVFDSTWARFKLQHGKVIQNPEWNRGVKMSVIGNIHQNPELLEQNDE